MSCRSSLIIRQKRRCWQTHGRLSGEGPHCVMPSRLLAPYHRSKDAGSLQGWPTISLSFLFLSKKKSRGNRSSLLRTGLQPTSSSPSSTPLSLSLIETIRTQLRLHPLVLRSTGQQIWRGSHPGRCCDFLLQTCRHLVQTIGHLKVLPLFQLMQDLRVPRTATKFVPSESVLSQVNKSHLSNGVSINVDCMGLSLASPLPLRPYRLMLCYSRPRKGTTGRDDRLRPFNILGKLISTRCPAGIHNCLFMVLMTGQFALSRDIKALGKFLS